MAEIVEQRGLRWYRCGKCRAKLFQGEDAIRARIEIRCHRCKTLNIFGRKQAA